MCKDGKFAEVIVDVANSNVDKIFDYKVPEGMDLTAGQRVFVPFGRAQIDGIVIRLKAESVLEETKIREISASPDEYPLLTDEQLRLAEYVAAEYHSTMGFVLRLMYPSAMRKERVKTKLVRMISVASRELLETARSQCYTKEGLVRAKNRLATIQAIEKEPTPSPLLDAPSVRRLIEAGAAKEEFVADYRRPYSAEEERTEDGSLPPMNREQSDAVGKICAHIESGRQRTILLHGVTGSGKTLVYIHCVRQALAQGKTAMLLVPEISLAPQLFTQFRREFGDTVAVFHSGLSDGERYDEWRRIREGEAKVVLGARSAVFMPLENIGVIILDEEHAESYKAENHPEYHAAVVARMRMQISGGTLVLASATPTIEDYMKAQLGIYDLVEIRHRVSGIQLPAIEVVDMKKEYVGGNTSVISSRLHGAIKDVLKKGEQAILFLNRRGYASSVICPSCGHVRMCTRCDIPLKYHKHEGCLMCHYCGRTFPFSNVCANCGDSHCVPMGVGTEQLEEQLAGFFPGARILRMDFDTTRGKNSHMRIYNAFKAKEADILIGTQMVARGLDFDNVTLAGIISADALLNYGGYRAEENTFSMIEQVGGRAGRKKPGCVIVQTFNPENYAVTRAQKHDYKGFYRDELGVRKLTQKPPFTRMFRMVFAHKDKAKVQDACHLTEKAIKCIVDMYEKDVILFLAREAPIEKIDGVYRYHIIVKVWRNRNTRQIKAELLNVWKNTLKKGVRTGFETDPYDVN